MPESVDTILARIEGKLDAHSSVLLHHMDTDEKRHESVSNKLRGIDKAIRGNGGDPGINVRLDRIEQREVGRARLAWIAVSAATAAVAASFKTWLSK